MFKSIFGDCSFLFPFKASQINANVLRFKLLEAICLTQNKFEKTRSSVDTVDTKYPHASEIQFACKPMAFYCVCFYLIMPPFLVEILSKQNLIFPTNCDTERKSWRNFANVMAFGRFHPKCEEPKEGGNGFSEFWGRSQKKT